jgi:addiction module HigA family antidote
MLLEEFLIPMGITQRELAKEIHVPYQRINEIINKRRGVTPSTALRLAKFFGVSEDFWMNLQLRSDIYKAKLNESKELETIRTIKINEELAHSHLSAKQINLLAPSNHFNKLIARPLSRMFGGKK